MRFTLKLLPRRVAVYALVALVPLATYAQEPNTPEAHGIVVRHDVVSDPKINLPWWESLKRVYEREKVVWRLFVGSQPTLEQNKLFAQFRAMLLKGSSLKPSA